MPVIDTFVFTQGLVGHSEPGARVLTFASETRLAECTDDEGRPVPDGVASAKVLITNLHNLTQPLIRYELTDRFTPAGTSAGGALRASVEGRSDDLFRYAGASVHPFVIGAPLLHAQAVREFQVRQTERGADIVAVIDGDFDQAAPRLLGGEQNSLCPPPLIARSPPANGQPIRSATSNGIAAAVGAGVADR